MNLQQIQRWLQTGKQRDQDGSFAFFMFKSKELWEKRRCLNQRRQREGQNGELDNVKKGQEEQIVERVLRFVLFLSLFFLSPCSRKLKKRELFHSKIQTLTIQNPHRTRIKL